jgi:Divergent InlB B-repeat domain
LRYEKGKQLMGTFKSLMLSIFVCVLWLSVAAQAQQALRFVPLTPCRVLDTRNPTGPLGGPAIIGKTYRDFPIPQSACGAPPSAAAYSLNVAAVPHNGILGFLTVWPTGQGQPEASTLNSIDGRVKANAAIVPAGTNGAISIYAADTADVIVDINGYFVDAATHPSALAFFPLSPCRVVDTRDASGPLAGPYLLSRQPRSFPLLSSSNCNIPTTVEAYSLNFSVVPKGSTLGWISAWPAGLGQPYVSILNDDTGTVTANAAIVPAGASGAISVYATDDTEVIIDINGYFAPAAPTDGLSLYTLPPCRVLDTRETSGAFVGTLTIDTTASRCRLPESAQAVVLGVAVVPQQPLGFLMLWPDQYGAPNVSTLNAYDALTTSNMAIVPTTNGVIDAYATDPTQLVLDTSGYFATSSTQPPIYVLTVARSGAGSGTVTSADGKINCPGGSCAASYTSGSHITLNATAASGNTFTGWSGGGCSGNGSCVVTMAADTTVTADFYNGIQPVIHLNPTSVGANLQQLATGYLTVAAPSGGLAVTVTSSDPSKLLLQPYASDPGGTSQGGGSFPATIPANKGLLGDFGFPAFWIQALASSGTPTITVSAPGYQSAVATVTLTPSGFVLNGPSGTGANFSTTLGTDKSLNVSVVQLNASHNVIATNQPLRGGLSANLTVTSGNTNVGTIANNPAAVSAGSGSSSSVTFQPAAVGTSQVSITQPAGFTAPNTGTGMTASVVQPTITFNPVTVGYNMQTQVTGHLDPAPTSPLNVTVSSSQGSVVLSTDPASPGGPSVNLVVPAGSTSLPAFYVQAVGSQNSSLSAVATGYTNGVTGVTVRHSAFILTGPNGTGNFTTTTFSLATPLTLTIYQLDGSNQPQSQGALRAGLSQTAVTVGSSNTIAGSVPGTASFNAGDSTKNLTFIPNYQSCVAPCSTNLTVAQPTGFTTPVTGGGMSVTVTKPTITLSAITSTIGQNLEVSGSGTLDAAYGGDDLIVTITSPSSSVLLAPPGGPNNAPATVQGSQTLDITIPKGQGLNGSFFPSYWIEALAGSGTVQLTATVRTAGGNHQNPGYNVVAPAVTLAPGGFVLNGGNGVGGNVATTAGSIVNISVIPVVLNAGSLTPTLLTEPVRGGFAASVPVSSDNGAAGVTNSPVGIAGGNSSGTATVQAGPVPGSAVITAGAPAGYSTPSSGNHLAVVVN